MNNRLLILASLLVSALFPASLQAQPVKTFSFQGELHDTAGDPVADGDYDVIFRLYTTSVGASEVWQESHSLNIVDGGFWVILGKNAPLPNFDKPLWLSLAVGRDPEMTPRIEIAGAPYALGMATPFVAVGSGSTNTFSVLKSSSTGGSAVKGDVDGTGYGIYGHATGAGIGVAGFSEGTGQAGWFEVQNPSSEEEAIFARSNGVAAVIAGQHEGTSGIAGWFGITNASNSSDALYGQTPGGGAGVSGKATGGGTGVFGQATGAGLAGLFQITNNSSSSTALTALTTGLGTAASFSNFNVGNSNNVLALNTYGSGALLVGSKSLVPEFIFENDGTLKLYNAGVPVITLDKDYNGDGRIFTEEIEITGGSDLSELFEILADDDAGEALPGMLVSIDGAGDGNLTVTSQAYDPLLVGVVSGAGGIETGMTMGQRGSVADGSFPVAIAGRVYVLADASNAPIRPGDLLTSSSAPGYAMKASDPIRAFGAVVGKALTGLPEGRGLVLALVSLH